MKVEMNNMSREYTNNSVAIEKRAIETSAKETKQTTKTQQPIKNDKEKVKEIVEKMNKELENIDTSIEFKVHESEGSGLNKISIKVVEKESEKVIVEIPSEESIEFAEKMEKITGLLFDHSM